MELSLNNDGFLQTKDVIGDALREQGKDPSQLELALSADGSAQSEDVMGDALREQGRNPSQLFRSARRRLHAGRGRRGRCLAGAGNRSEPAGCDSERQRLNADRAVMGAALREQGWFRASCS